MMEELDSKLGVVADLSALEMRTSATPKMSGKGIKQFEIDVFQDTAFPLNEATEMSGSSNISNCACRGRIPHVRGHLQTRRCVVHWFHGENVVAFQPGDSPPTIKAGFTRNTTTSCPWRCSVPSFDGENVTFRWKDYAHGNKQRKMTLSANEFLRRFTQHILPRGFVRIRQFGYLANTHRSARLALARQLLAVAPEPSEVSAPVTAETSTYRCPHCNGEMRIGPNLSARQLASQCRSLDSS
jgi:hypothetical protein